MTEFIIRENVNKKIDKITEKYHKDENELLQILLETQRLIEKNYIPKEVSDKIAYEVGVPNAKVYNLVTFFDALSDKPRGKFIINICEGTTCSLKNKNIVETFEKKLNINIGETTEDERYTLRYSPCFGACDISPAVRINDDVYGNLTEEKIEKILVNIESKNINNELVNILPKKNKNTVSYITSNFGKYNGLNIEEYIELGGFKSLEKAFEIGYEAVAEEVIKSGLKGRGGAAYPTGKKLLQGREAEGERKFVVCNADEGEPGTFKDREILKNDPYRVIEGIIIASFVDEAKEGIIYIREEYTWLHQRIRDAIDKCYEKGYLGKNILGKGHDFDLRVFSGAGSYICGEGFALCESMEGRPGMPRTKPPYVKQAGYLHYPTLIQNVETLSAIAAFLKDGSEKVLEYGTNSSPGTKVISLSGKINRPGVYEVPFGMSLKDIIEKIGFGIIEDKKIGFVQIGGASGGIIPGDKVYDTIYDYSGLTDKGVSLGSGAIVVADEDDDIIEYVSVLVEFFLHESCGKCTPCREGNRQLKRIMNRFKNYKGTEEDLENYEKIVYSLKNASLCGSGKTEAVPLKLALNHFKKEFENRIK